MAYRIRPLLLGTAEVPNVLDIFWSLSTDRGRSDVPILGFLIEGGPDGPIVVDCGMRDPRRAMEIHRLGPHACAPEQSLPAQLALHGVTPADVRTLVLTHLHYDHCGQLRRAAERAHRRAAERADGSRRANGACGAARSAARACSTTAPTWPSWSTRCGTGST